MGLRALPDDVSCFFFFFQAEDGIRDLTVTGVQTCALPISSADRSPSSPSPICRASNEASDLWRCAAGGAVCGDRQPACTQGRLGTADVSKGDRKSTRLNSSHSQISYAVFCLKKKKKIITTATFQTP